VSDRATPAQKIPGATQEAFWWHTPTDFAALIQDALAEGSIVRTQTKGKNPKHAYFDFIGGPWHGARLRLYPPFEKELVLNGYTYVLAGPKDNRSERTCYRLARETPHDVHTHETCGRPHVCEPQGSGLQRVKLPEQQRGPPRGAVPGPQPGAGPHRTQAQVEPWSASEAAPPSFSASATKHVDAK